MTHNERQDYEPVDLSASCNAGLEVLEGHRTPPVGACTFHGIPFLIGDPADGAAPCFVLLEPGAPSVTVPVARSADRVIVAHRWLRRGGPELDPMPGSVVAEYAFRLQDGTVEPVEILERFEIAAAADEGWDASGPFVAAGTSEIVLLDRYVGRWEEIGQRQCETVYGGLGDYFLWV